MANKKVLALILLLIVIMVVSVACTPSDSANEESIDVNNENYPSEDVTNDEGMPANNMMPPPLPE